MTKRCIIETWYPRNMVSTTSKLSGIVDLHISNVRMLRQRCVQHDKTSQHQRLQGNVSDQAGPHVPVAAAQSSAGTLLTGGVSSPAKESMAPSSEAFRVVPALAKEQRCSSHDNFGARTDVKRLKISEASEIASADKRR